MNKLLKIAVLLVMVALTAGAPANATYIPLPDFLKMLGTLGEPKADINKLVLVELGARTGLGVAGKIGGATTGSTASPATITSSSLTTLVPNELLYSLANANDLTSATLTAQSPFTDIGPNFAVDAGYDVASSVTGYTASFAMTLNSANFWSIGLAGFRPSATSTPPSTGRHRAMVIQH